MIFIKILVQTKISNIQKNINIDKKIFKIQKILINIYIYFFRFKYFHSSSLIIF